MSANSNSKALHSWSDPVNQLAGRVRVEFEDLKPGLRHAVYLELKNHSLDPIALTNQPEISAELYDSSGQSVSTSSFSSNGPSPIKQWAVVPRDAYVALRVDLQTAGIPAKEHQRVFLGIDGRTWELSTGSYSLRCAASFKHDDAGPPKQWTGELTLPPVEVVVTDDMFSE
jgi:hypothetical protein